MAHDRGAANILRFNAEREGRIVALVGVELAFCRRQRLSFRSIGRLAAYLSERTGIHRTSLIRNEKYNLLLASYIRSQPGAAFIVDETTSDVYVLRAKLAATQAEVGSLRQETKRLAAQLSRQKSASQPETDGRNNEVDFADVCALLSLVLVRAGTFAIEEKSRSLVDLAARPSERLVGGPERTSSFISWMRTVAGSLLTKGIKTL